MSDNATGCNCDGIKQSFCQKFLFDEGMESSGCSVKPCKHVVRTQTSASTATSSTVYGGGVSSSAYVKLNVGGSLFYTTVSTLVSRSEWFRVMFSGRQMILTDTEDWILIDRSGKHFATILNYMRNGSSSIAYINDARDLMELKQEASYFCIDDLLTVLEDRLRQIKEQDEKKVRDLGCVSSIVILKCPKQDKWILSNTSRPIVKLTMNRSNNVFSYTNNSQDFLLRHIECLEKYALMFADTVIFIRDVRNEKNEVCEWSFHYRSYKLKSIDCTSIHYTADGRLTKVEFPEPKIHEEMLNLISLAHRNVTDVELMDIVLKKQSHNTVRLTTGVPLNGVNSNVPPGAPPVRPHALEGGGGHPSSTVVHSTMHTRTHDGELSGGVDNLHPQYTLHTSGTYSSDSHTDLRTPSGESTRIASGMILSGGGLTASYARRSRAPLFGPTQSLMGSHTSQCNSPVDHPCLSLQFDEENSGATSQLRSGTTSSPSTGGHSFPRKWLHRISLSNLMGKKHAG